MQLRLDGRTAVVTGASRGIGRAIAESFLAAGADVMLVSRTAESLAAVAAELEVAPQAGADTGGRGQVAWFAANTGEPESASACLGATVDRFGSVDVLVNNAATNPYFGPIVDLDRSRADKTLRVNQSAVLEWVQAAWRAGMSERGGAVLNIASVGGLSVEGGIGWYNVTKAAVMHLTRQLAGELGPKVRVNALAPGLVRTHFARALWESSEEPLSRRLPLRRIGEPEDVAGAALFLCSDAAEWVTGATLVVDGGALCVASGGIA